MLWQDREVRFDVSPKQLQLRSGEKAIDVLSNIEDSKGNPGVFGTLFVTNLRLIWQSDVYARTNLSIGYKTMSQLKIDLVDSKLRGHTQALYILCRTTECNFQFIFTSIVPDSPRLFTTLQTVYRAFETSRAYRDLKLRGAIVKDGDLIVLPNEEILHHQSNVYNLASNQGNVGELYYSNVRVVWYASGTPNFNVSIPYVAISSIKIRNTRHFGKALVFTTDNSNGGYMIGFSVQPDSQLEAMHVELSKLWEIFAENPIFGVEYTVSTQPKTIEEVTVPRVEDKVKIEDSENTKITDNFVAYFTLPRDDEEQRPVIKDANLGLAFEEPRENFTLEQLWNIVDE
ncbi:hypothetical protein PCE1_000855 [Barthelona sp. PCE]